MDAKPLVRMLCCLLLLAVVSAGADDSGGLTKNREDVLNAKPNRCIALRQGQFCYQKVEFRWYVGGETEHCLYLEAQEKPLVCWQGAKLHKYDYEFKALQGQKFFIRDEVSGDRVAETAVDVAWVYKSGKKVSTGWRLF